MYARNNGLSAVSLRYFYVYGPRQRPDMAIARFMRGLIDGQDVEVFGDGEQTRDFTYVTDVVEATMRAITVNVKEENIFNVGAGSRASVNAVLAQLEEIAGIAVGRRYVPAAPEDHRHGGASINLARRYLDWEPRVSLREGLTRQWSWVQEVAGREARALVAS
jgi:UDP-glucose 4-epimerase